jgi:hypothetical protein
MVSTDDNLRSLAAARGRLLSSTTHHTNTADDEVKFSVAADPISPSDYLRRLAATRRLYSATHHTNTADDEDYL